MATIKLIGDAPNQVSRNRDLGTMAHVDIAEANGYIVDAAPSATTPLAGTEELAVVQSGDTKKVSVDNLTAGRAVSASALTVNGGSNSLVSFTNNIGSGTRPSVNYGLFLGRNASGGFNEANIIWGTGGAAPAFRIQSWNGTTLTNQFALETSGNAYLDIGNLVIGTSGKGIDFSATSNAAGMTSELLDDYEEGTWTPVFVAYDGTVTIDGATYVKIGQLVTAFFMVTFDGTTDSSQVTVSLSGFPFNIASDNSFAAQITFNSATGGGNPTKAQRAFTSSIVIQNETGGPVTYAAMGTGKLGMMFTYRAV